MKKFLSFMLTLLTVLTLGATFHANAATGDTYTKVTDASTLANGDVIAIGRAGFVVNSHNDTELKDTAASIANGVLTWQKGILDFVVETGTEDGQYNLKIGDKYLLPNGKKLKFDLNADSAGVWNITITDTGAKILDKAQNKWLAFNDANNCMYYRLYNNELKLPVIYKKSESKVYTVQFDANGQKFVDGFIDYNEYDLGVTTTLNLPTSDKVVISDNSYLLGWTDGTNYYYPGEEVKVLDKNVTFTAVYRSLELEVAPTIPENIITIAKAHEMLADNPKPKGKVSMVVTVESIKYDNSVLKDETGTLNGYKCNQYLIKGHKYIVTGTLGIYSNNDQIKFFDAIELKNEFNYVNTKSRLVATLDTEAQTLNNVELALGGQLSKTFYEANSANKFGVIALSAKNVEAVLSLDNLDKAGLDDLIAKNYALELTPVLDGENYNFAWSIDNIPADKYGFEFVSVMYMLDAEGNVALANEKKTSIEATAKQYVEKADQYQFSEELLAAIKKVAKVA